MGNSVSSTEASIPTEPDFLQSAREPLLTLVDKLEAENKFTLLDDTPKVPPSKSFTSRSFNKTHSGSRKLQRGVSRKYSLLYRGVLPNKVLLDSIIGNDIPENLNSDDFSLSLDDNGYSEVAIRRMILGEGPGGRDMYWKEVNIVSRLNHPNIVRLLGFCCEKGEAILVYEFMTKGNLKHLLFPEGLHAELAPVLSFEERISILQDVAQGLLCLHENKIIHRDLRPGNIFLDKNSRAKIGGLRLARELNSAACSPPSNRVIGHVGYICPLYMETGNLSTKIDVFSFGVTLLQVLAGRPWLYRDETGEIVQLADVLERPELEVITDEEEGEDSKQIMEALREKASRLKMEDKLAKERRKMDVRLLNDGKEASSSEKVEDEDLSFSPGENGYLKLDSVSDGLEDQFGSKKEYGGNVLGRQNVAEYVNSFHAFMDPRLEGKYDERKAKKLAFLGIRCVQEVPSLRPKSTELVEKLTRLT